MRKILEKIFLDEIQGHKRTICVSCGRKTNLNEPPFISIAVLRLYGTCVCSYCVNSATIKARDHYYGIGGEIVRSHINKYLDKHGKSPR